MAAEPKKESLVAPRVTPHIPPHLNEKAQAEIRDAQDVMRQLIRRIPREFGHGDELALAFQPRP